MTTAYRNEHGELILAPWWRIPESGDATDADADIRERLDGNLVALLTDADDPRIEWRPNKPFNARMTPVGAGIAARRAVLYLRDTAGRRFQVFSPHVAEVLEGLYGSRLARWVVVEFDGAFGVMIDS